MGSCLAEQALVFRVLRANEGTREATERGVRDTRDVGRRRKERKEGAFLRRAYLSLYARPLESVRVSLTERPVNSELT